MLSLSPTRNESCVRYPPIVEALRSGNNGNVSAQGVCHGDRGRNAIGRRPVHHGLDLQQMLSNRLLVIFVYAS